MAYELRPGRMVTWIATAVGSTSLHRAVRDRAVWSGRRLLGGMAIGWGGFNLVEGAVDHGADVSLRRAA